MLPVPVVPRLHSFDSSLFCTRYEQLRKLKSEEIRRDSGPHEASTVEEMDEESDDVPMRDENEHREDSDDMSDDELQDRMLKENKERKTKHIDIERMTNR